MIACKRWRVNLRAPHNHPTTFIRVVIRVVIRVDIRMVIKVVEEILMVTAPAVTIATVGPMEDVLTMGHIAGIRQIITSKRQLFRINSVVQRGIVYLETSHHLQVGFPQHERVGQFY